MNHTPTSEEAWAEYLEARAKRPARVVVLSTLSVLWLWPFYLAHLAIRGIKWACGL